MHNTLTLETARNPLRDVLLVLFASFLICLSGQIAIPLWFTPVPIATQNSFVLLLALLLGPRRASAAVFLFLLQGAMDLPVFSNGCSGFLHLLRPTGGYLIGYLIATFLTGVIHEKKKSPILALLAGNLAIYLCGASYLATFVGLKKAFLLGIAPFILGDLLKMMASLKIVQWSRK